MKIWKFGLFLIPCILAFAQETPAPAVKPPDEVDQALRARVAQFYHAFESGKFREAYLLVSEDSQDAFMESSKDQYKKCDTIKIDYTDNFTKAKVLESCLGTMRWHGGNMPTTVPLSSNWKLQNGQWDWCYVRPTEVMTPWGISKVPPQSEIDEAPKTKPVIPDARAMAQMILKAVQVDKQSVWLHSWETSRDEVHVSNAMPGSVDLKLEVPKQPGLKVHAAKTTLAQNEETTIVFEYKLDDAEVLCGDCAKKVHGTATVQLIVEPTGRVFPITVTFELPPEVEKQLPKELQPKKK